MNSLGKHRWLLILLIHIPFVALAQRKVSSFDPVKPLWLSSIDQWTSESGLVSNNLTSVIQAPDGFLWITTYNGIHRFDGVNFELFDRENISFLKSDAFYRGYSADNKLLFPSQGSGIVVFENNEFRSLLPENKLLPLSIRCLLISGNEIWAGSNNRGLYVIRDTAAIQIEHKPVRDISIMSLAQDQYKNIWVATNGNGVIKITGETFEQFTTTQGLSSNVINTIRCTAEGDVMIGTTKGLDILSNGRITKPKLFQGIQINSMTIDDLGSGWLATERGLGRINYQLGTEELLTKEYGLPTLELTSLAFDREGTLWVTSSKAGLIRLKDTGIVTYSETNGLSLDLINIISEGPDGKIYIGNDGGGIDVLHNNKIQKLKLNHSLQVSIRDIYVGQSNTLWIASYDGVLIKKGGNETLLNTSNGLPVQDIRRIIKDKRGSMWFASRSGGALRYTNNKVDAIFNKESGLNSNYILAIKEDHDGNVYLGTNGGGLSRIDPQGGITNFNIDEDDSGLLIFNIQIDDDGNIFLITNTGLYHFNGASFKKLDFTHNIKGETYFDWVEDNDGSVWLTSNKGIIRFKKSAVEAFLLGKLAAIDARLYNHFDGMKNKECTGATRVTKTSGGEIWVPTIGGASVIFPKQIRENTFIPPVYITNLITDDEIFQHGDIKTKPGNLRYTFQFTGLSFYAPEQNQFKFKLENFDKDWIESGGDREASYTNLPPGKYTFKVMGSNNDGVWNSKSAELSFRVVPYFYQTTLFYISVTTIILAIFFGFYKWRVSDIERRNAELRKVNSELDRFVYSASHDLRAPLTSILGLVNVARLDDGKEKNAYLNLIERSVKKLDGFIHDIIDFSRNARLDLVNDEIHFEKLIHDTMDDLKYLDESSRIMQLVTVNGKGKFYSDHRRLKIILSNLMSNAIKYHNIQNPNPYIEVKVEYDDRKATIRVVDNGSGIYNEHLSNIFEMFYRGNERATGSGLGLYIVRETTEKLRGSISVKSKPGEGSTFEITLPNMRN